MEKTANQNDMKHDPFICVSLLVVTTEPQQALQIWQCKSVNSSEAHIRMLAHRRRDCLTKDIPTSVLNANKESDRSIEPAST